MPLLRIRSVLFLAGALLATASSAQPATSLKAAHEVLDQLHHLASQADGEAYFALFTNDAVFLGTDASERWTVDQFKAYAMPYFSAGRGWTYQTTERNINVAASGQHASFDELLANQHFGICRGTGVLRRVDGEWKIEQYHLTIPLPNALAHDIAGTIKAHTNREAHMLLRESFDGAALPPLFTVGQGDWVIVDQSLRGQQLAADNHTAFRKIYLDHQNVEYAYDLKLEDEAFHQLLINWGLAHIAKVVIRYDEVSILKIREDKKRLQMSELGHDQGRDPLKGDYSQATHALASAPLALKPAQWYRVVVRMIDDTIQVSIDDTEVTGQHIGITEKKDNFGFQAGGLEGAVYIDNIEVIGLVE